MDDTDSDRAAVQPLVDQVAVYPLSQFTGRAKTVDWKKAPQYPQATNSNDEAETQWVDPEKFADVLGAVVAEVPPLSGEQALYDQFRTVLTAIGHDPRLRAAFTQAAGDADRELVQPLFEFRNYGLSLPHNWTTIANNAQFGTDYFTRAAAAKSNIFVNAPAETRYFYGDLDADGQRLNGAQQYRVTFGPGALPPVRGFWSLTLYNHHHFFHVNELNRYSLGTKNKNLAIEPDGTLTLYVQANAPDDERTLANWLPAPSADFSLYLRAYWPSQAIHDGTWTPPPIARV
jgi:hypothetical protein